MPLFPNHFKPPRNSKRPSEGKQLEIKTFLKKNPKNEELQDVAIHTSIERRRQEHQEEFKASLG